MKQANRLIRRFLCALELAKKKGAFWTIEQPGSSLLFNYSPVRETIQRHGARFVYFNMGEYGARTMPLGFKT